MNATANIESLHEVLAHEGPLSLNESFKNPRNPAWTCFDDDKEIDEELKAFRETLLDFEEWNAGREAPGQEEVDIGIFHIIRNITEWDEPNPSISRYQERQEAREYNNWLIQFHKRMLHSPSNDRFHKILRSLGQKMTDEDMELAVNPISELRKVLKERVKYAPGPIGGTVFRNPDGSRYETKGIDSGKAKASFIKRHKLEDEFVSVDRVQYEGEKTSKYVIGVRKASNETPSHYYDPNPTWRDCEGGTYAPRACALFMVNSSCVMPKGSHRLSVREFEQALIAGAHCYDDADEAFAGIVEADFNAEGSSYFEEDDNGMSSERIYDGRVTLMNTGSGTQGRSVESFTEEEEFLYNAFRMIAAEQEASLMLLANQEPNMIHRSIMSSGDYSNVVGLIRFTEDTAPEYLEFVKKALLGDEEVQVENHLESEIYSGAVALFDDQEDSWSVPTGPNGACKRAACLNWK